MSDASANININFEGDAFIAIKNLQGEFNKLIQKVTVFEGDVKESFNSLNTSVKTYKTAISQLSFAAIADNVRNVTDAFRGMVQPGLDFEQKMADLSAITGVSGNDLSVLSAAAREMGTSSGIGASQAVEAFKLLASNIDISTIGGVEGLKARTVVMNGGTLLKGESLLNARYHMLRIALIDVICNQAAFPQGCNGLNTGEFVALVAFVAPDREIIAPVTGFNGEILIKHVLQEHFFHVIIHDYILGKAFMQVIKPFNGLGN